MPPMLSSPNAILALKLLFLCLAFVVGARLAVRAAIGTRTTGNAVTDFACQTTDSAHGQARAHHKREAQKKELQR